jgi:hypothetical protein
MGAVTAAARLRAWAPRVLAPLVAAAVAGALYVLTNLPYATRSESSEVAPWKAARGEMVTFGFQPQDLKADSPVLSMQGAAGRGLNVTFTRAAFGPDTQTDLRITNHADLAERSPSAWASYPGGDARQGLAFGLTPTGAHPRLAIKPSGDGQTAQMTLIARDASLNLRLEAALDAAAQPPEMIGPNGAWRLQLQGGDGGFPIDVVVPPDQPVVVNLPEDSLPATSIRLGAIAETGDPALLYARSLAIRGLDDRIDRLRACGAREKAVSWTSTKVGLDSCLATLRLVDLTLANDGVTVEVNGRAFVARDGEALVLPLQKISENPLVSAAVGGASTWLVVWAWQALTRRQPKQPPRKKPAPRKAAASG